MDVADAHIPAACIAQEQPSVGGKNVSPMDGFRYVRPKRAAQMIGVSTQMIYQSIYSGELRATKLRGRSWLIEPADLEDWISRNSEVNVGVA